MLLEGLLKLAYRVWNIEDDGNCGFCPSQGETKCGNATFVYREVTDMVQAVYAHQIYAVTRVRRVWEGALSRALSDWLFPTAIIRT